MKKDTFKVLFFLVLVLFLVDLVIPDPFPLIDEIILLAGTFYTGKRGF